MSCTCVYEKTDIRGSLGKDVHIFSSPGLHTMHANINMAFHLLRWCWWQKGKNITALSMTIAVTESKRRVQIEIPWAPEVFLACGRRKSFASLRQLKADGTSSEAARKTSGTERFHSPFSLNFDQFYRITFKPITASISHCDHMDWHVKT